MKFSLVFLILYTVSNSLLAQINAGELPLGYTLYESDLMLEIDDIIIAIDLIDLNFDGKQDLKFQIEKGANGNNSASISLENESIGVCHIQGLNYTPAEIHEDGTLLECIDSTGFDLNPALVGIGLGRFEAGTVLEFPAKISNEYLHYEWKTETESIEGWIKISFDLTVDTIFLTLHEWIIKDEIVSNTQTTQAQNNVTIFPNPVQEGILNIDSEQNVENYEIYNLQGKLLKRGANFGNKIQLGKIEGMVAIKLQFEHGTITKTIFI